MGDNKKLIYISPMVWLIRNGYIPRDSDLKKKKKDNPYLEGWLLKHLYMRSSDWERDIPKGN